jgi:hypothetical protein
MRKIAIFLWILLSAVSGLAEVENREPVSQSRPNLSGTWALDKTKTDLKHYDRDLKKSGITLVVEHHETEIKITRTFKSEGKDRKQELVYYTDGRGEKNPILEGGKMRVKSHTRWIGNELMTKSIFRNPLAERGVFEQQEVLTKWELSNDGRTLTQTISVSKPNINLPGRGLFIPSYSVEKRVFNRVP